METRREATVVGLFVIIACTLLLVAIFGITGAFSKSSRVYHAKFSNAGGLEPGATVRYEGGPKVGRVEGLGIDKTDASKIDISFSVNEGVPLKTDSLVVISALSPLGDNQLELRAGSSGSPLAQPGAVLPSKPYSSLNDVTDQLNALGPKAQELVNHLDERVVELKTTIARVNDLLNDQNRQNVAGTLTNLHGMIAENRPQVKSTLQNINTASAKIDPLIVELRKAVDQANKTLVRVDDMIGENRPDVRASVQQLHASLNNINEMTGRLNRITDANTENLDEIIENMRKVSENLKQFTDALKANPSSLLRSSNPKE